MAAVPDRGPASQPDVARGLLRRAGTSRRRCSTATRRSASRTRSIPFVSSLPADLARARSGRVRPAARARRDEPAARTDRLPPVALRPLARVRVVAGCARARTRHRQRRPRSAGCGSSARLASASSCLPRSCALGAACRAPPGVRGSRGRSRRCVVPVAIVAWYATGPARQAGRGGRERRPRCSQAEPVTAPAASTRQRRAAARTVLRLARRHGARVGIAPSGLLDVVIRGRLRGGAGGAVRDRPARRSRSRAACR